jgi:hypothetical protein
LLLAVPKSKGVCHATSTGPHRESPEFVRSQKEKGDTSLNCGFCGKGKVSRHGNG